MDIQNVTVAFITGATIFLAGYAAGYISRYLQAKE